MVDIDGELSTSDEYFIYGGKISYTGSWTVTEAPGANPEQYDNLKPILIRATGYNTRIDCKSMSLIRFVSNTAIITEPDYDQVIDFSSLISLDPDDFSWLSDATAVHVSKSPTVNDNTGTLTWGTTNTLTL